MKMESTKRRTFALPVFILCFLIVSPLSFCRGAGWIDGRAGKGVAKKSSESPGSAISSAQAKLDTDKYITVDEIRPGMEAYCLTVYEGDRVEKFSMEVLSVVRGIRPGRDAIMVKGIDERFVHTGPVAGCSGSPVYVDGRLAGALAFGWFYSKDPLYGVTPIEEMLKVGQGGSSEGERRGPAVALDYSVPIDFAEVERQVSASLASHRRNLVGASRLPCPLVTSGLPAGACEQLAGLVELLGLMAVPGISSSAINGGGDKGFVPGACLAVPLVTGDITMDVIGTVTEVVGDSVYGFGHSFLGYGAVDLPIATGEVHTVVSSMVRSFKLASARTIVGALRTDESAAVYGRIGAESNMIPLSIKIERYNDPEAQLYECRLVDNRLLTAPLLRSVLFGAAFVQGDMPPDHTVDYRVSIALEGAEAITFGNVSTSLGLEEMVRESMGSVAMLMNNPYQSLDIKSVDAQVRIVAENIVSRLWSVGLSDSAVKAGDEIEFEVIVESFLSGKKKYRGELKVPKNLSPGNYNFMVLGGYGYQEFLRKAAPQRFAAQNLPSLINAINNILSVRRDKLYCVLVLPAGGMTLEHAELPDLPGTKALVLASAKRSLRVQPYHQWVEKSFDVGAVIIDKKVMRVTVEK